MTHTPRRLLVLCSVLLLGGSSAPAAPGRGTASPAKWRTWHLTSPSQLRLAPPPAARSATTRRELAELRNLQQRRTKQTRQAVLRWNSRPAVVPWTELALKMIQTHRPRPPFAARALALLETGMYDALVAANDSRAAHARTTRPAPAQLDGRLRPLLRAPRGSSYAPPEAAIAGAAESILTYLFPAEPARTFRTAADEAVRSRLWAGLNYRSDVVAARALGRSVARIVIAHGESDGHQLVGFAHSRLFGEPYWSPTPPAFEQPTGGPVGLWKPWLLPSPGALRNRIPGPSPYGSPAFMAELREVVRVSETLTEGQKAIAFFWDDGPRTFTPAGHWLEIAIRLVKTYELGGPQTARVFALLGATGADAAIASFEAKYYWWSIRPITAIWRLCDGGAKLCTEAELAANPSRATYREDWRALIPTPPFPSYPGGHSTFSGACGKLLTYFFPQAANTLNQLADEAAASRLYAGIHFDEDNDAGLVLGRAVADLAIQRARTDGAG